MPETTVQRLRDTQAYAILDNAPDVVMRYGVDGRCLYVNKAGERIAGRSRDEIVGKYPGESGAPEESTAPLREIFGKVMKTKQPEQYEVRYAGRVFQSVVVPELDEEGKVTAFFAYLHDVTSLKKIEEAFITSEKSFFEVFEASPVVIVISSMKDGHYLAVNRTFEEASGYARREVLGKTSDDLGIFPEPGLRAQLLQELREKGRVFGREILFKGKGGRSIIGLTSVIPFTFRQQPCLLFVGIDITQRKKTEEAMLESEQRYRSLYENSLDAVLLTRPDGTILNANPQAQHLFGMTEEELKKAGRTGILVYDARTAAALEERRRKGRARAELTYRRKDGSIFPGEASSGIFRDADGSLKTSMIIRDISERRKVETALRESEALLDTFFSNTPIGMIIYDADNRYVRLNKYAAELFSISVSEAVGRSIYDVMPSDLAAATAMRNKKVLETGKAIATGVYRAQLPLRSIKQRTTFWQGYRFPVPLAGGEKGVGLVTLDVTDRVQAEDTLRRNEYELRTLVDNSPDLIFRLDHRLRYTYANPAYERITGLLRENMTGRTNRELGMLPRMIDLWDSAVRMVIDSGQNRALEFDIDSLFGKRCFFAQLIPEFAKTGLVETVLVIARDITERKRAEERIRYISFHDEVTGLFNRAFFEEEIRRVDTERDLPISIIMGDVNFLKLSNDVFGHMEGDRLLKAIAVAIRHACRQSDIVSRWGGDEFAVILPKTDFPVTDEIVYRIKQTAADSGGTVVRPSIALGIATKKQRDQNIYQVIRRAEERMYDNKIAESRLNAGNVLSKLMERAREGTRDMARHIDELSGLARRFGKELGLEEEQLKNLELLIGMHDIGTATVPEGILTKPGRLSGDEWRQVKKHPEAGFRIVKSFPDTARISDEVLSHDERWDGTGYPRGLKGREIPYLARVFALIEAYDVMTHDRPYARAFSTKEALEELRRNAGRQFDPELAEKFITFIQLQRAEVVLR